MFSALVVASHSRQRRVESRQSVCPRGTLGPLSLGWLLLQCTQPCLSPFQDAAPVVPLADMCSHWGTSC